MFTPEVGLELVIEGKTYRVAAHPAAPWMPYGQEGRAAIVYRLEAETGEAVALKVFKERFRTPSLVGLKRKLEPFATLPGLTVCRREVLTPTRHQALLQRYPDLLYAVLMPWIEGPTWQEIVQTRQAITPDQSQALAQGLLNILVRMEEEGIAHCDLSGPNVLLPILAGGEGVELVDVEGIYAPGLTRPAMVFSGTLGYAHHEARVGAWHHAADRFAGAILLAEMLGWCDERVRGAAWGESYFAPNELQQPSKRYRLLQQVLAERWGKTIGQLLAQAWESNTLEDAPSFGTWMVHRPGGTTPPPIPSPLMESQKEDQGDMLQVLIALGEQFEKEGEWESAVHIYQQALDFVSTDDVIQQEALSRRIRRITSQMERIPLEKIERPAAIWNGEKLILQEDTEEQPVIQDSTIMEEEATEEEATPRENIEKSINVHDEGNQISPRSTKKIHTSWVVGGVILALILIGWMISRVIIGQASERSITSTPTTTPSATPIPTSTFTPTPALPVLAGTPVLPSSGPISLQNAEAVASLARWGEGIIQALAYSPDGELLAVATSLGVYLYDAQTLEELYFLESGSWTTSVAFSPDGRILAAGCGDHVVRLWRVSDGTLLRTLTGHTRSVSSVAFSPNGETLASGSADGSVRLWKVSNGSLLYTLRDREQAVEVYNIAFSPDGMMLAAGCADGVVRLWDVTDGSLLRILEGHTSKITSIAFSLARILASGSADGTVRLWRVSDGRLLHTLKGHTDDVLDVAFSPDGTMLASGSQDNTVRLWDTADGSMLRILEGDMGEVWSIDFSPDGETLATGSDDGSLRLWRVSDGHLRFLHTLEGHAARVWSVAFSPDGKTLASASGDHTVRLWQTSNGTLLRTLANMDRVLSVAFSPNGMTLASGAWDGTVRLWQVSNGNLLYTLEGHTGRVTSVAFSPDGTMLASGSGDDNVCLWKVSDGSLLRTLKGHTDSVLSVAFSPDGAMLASSSDDGTVRLWRVSDGHLLRTLEGHTDGVRSIAFSPSGKILASGSWDHTVRLWRVSDGGLLRTLNGHRSGVLSVAFSLDGEILASGGWDNVVHLWQVSNGSLLHTLEGHTSGVTSVVFSPNGYYIASGSHDGTVRLWGVPAQ